MFLDKWEQDLSAVYLPYEHQKGVIGKIQLAMRPIRMYEIAFPKPMMNDVLRKIQPTQSWNPGYEKFLWMMRKALKLDPIPPNIPPRLIGDAFWHNDIDCTGIGMKEDRVEDGVEKL